MNIQASKARANIHILDHDVNRYYYNIILKNEIVAWDIETSGLDWKYDQIGTCQLYTPNYEGDVVIVKINKKKPTLLKKLLETGKIIKIFHHAMFDLRFMTYHWSVKPINISCTKISSKILEKNEDFKHSLRNLLKEYLGVRIQKDQTKSNWFNKVLTKEQKSYAINDVIYLIKLFNVIKAKLISKDLWDLTLNCFKHIPTRVKLDILQFPDVYTY